MVLGNSAFEFLPPLFRLLPPLRGEAAFTDCQLMQKTTITFVSDCDCLLKRLTGERPGESTQGYLCSTRVLETSLVALVTAKTLLGEYQYKGEKKGSMDELCMRFHTQYL